MSTEWQEVHNDTLSIKARIVYNFVVAVAATIVMC
jgi:hypothetical protein